MKKFEFLEDNLARQLLWIQAADGRIALLLPLNTAMLGVLAVLAPAYDYWTVFSAVSSSFAAALLVLSVVFTALAAFPRTEGPKGSLVFFSGIVAREEDQFSAAIESLDDDVYLRDLTSQVYVNAKIASQKFSWVRRAMVCLFLSSIPWTLAIYSLYQG